MAGGASLTIANPTTIKSGATVTKTGTVLIQAPLTIESGGGLMIASGPTTLTAPGLSGSRQTRCKEQRRNDRLQRREQPGGDNRRATRQRIQRRPLGRAGINSSSTIANQTALGWTDDPASQAITIKYALYGDADRVARSTPLISTF